MDIRQHDPAGFAGTKALCRDSCRRAHLVISPGIGEAACPLDLGQRTLAGLTHPDGPSKLIVVNLRTGLIPTA
jgi:hypothetical protein